MKAQVIDLARVGTARPAIDIAHFEDEDVAMCMVTWLNVRDGRPTDLGGFYESTLLEDGTVYTVSAQALSPHHGLILCHAFLSSTEARDLVRAKTKGPKAK